MIQIQIWPLIIDILGPVSQSNSSGIRLDWALGSDGDYQTRESSGIIEGSHADRPNYKNYLCCRPLPVVFTDHTRGIAPLIFVMFFEGRSHGGQSAENGTYCVARGTWGLRLNPTLSSRTTWS